MKALLIAVLLLFTLTISCQGKSGLAAGKPAAISILKDPFLLYYLRDTPTLLIDTSENVANLTLWYKNFDKKEVDYGDRIIDTFDYSIYLFIKGLFYGIDSAKTEDGKLLERYKSIEIFRKKNGLIESMNSYVDQTGKILYRNTFKNIKNCIITNERSPTRTLADVILQKESGFSYYKSYKTYTMSPDKPDCTVEFLDNDIIITEYSYLVNKDTSEYYFTGGIANKYWYTDGILMKRELINRRTETYTVSSGKGEIIVTNPAGEVTERKTLERRINAAGYLEYEAVRNADGTGYETFYTKDTLGPLKTTTSP